MRRANTHVAPLALLGLLVMSAMVTSLEMAFSRPTWLGSWGETSRAYQQSTVLLYPLLAAASAWIASGPRRHKYEWLTRLSAHDAASTNLLLSARLAVSAAVGSAAALIVSLVATSREATFGHPPWLEFLVPIVGIGVATSWGIVMAARLPPMAATIAALVLPYLLLFIVDPADPTFAQFSAVLVSSDRDRTYIEAIPIVSATKVMFLISFAAFLASIAQPTKRVWALPATTTCLLVTPLLIIGSADVRVDTRAQEPVCTTDEPYTLCLTAANAHMTDAVIRSLAAPVAALKGLRLEQVALVDEAITPQDVDLIAPRYRFLLPLHITNGTDGDAHVVDKDELVISVTNGLLRASCEPARFDPQDIAERPEGGPADVIQRWLLDEVGVSTEPDASYELAPMGDDVLDYSRINGFRTSWESASPEQRQSWLRSSTDDVLTCSIPRSARL